MSIRFETQDGRQGTLDVVKVAAEEFNAIVTGVQDGIVIAKTPDGGTKRFSLAEWAGQNGATITQMDGFNGPDTALDSPPNGMNHVDQTVFYHDGMDMESLEELFPKAMKRNDGRVVVLDNDGLWKTMWSPYLTTPLPPMSFNEMVEDNQVNDPRMVMRNSGIIFLGGLAGMSITNEKDGNFKVDDIVEALKVIARNAPYENKYQVGKLVHQTTGLDPWKFYNALLSPTEVGKYLKLSKAAGITSFQFRMKQADFAEFIVEGMQVMSKEDMLEALQPLSKLPEVKGLIVNLQGMFQEFVQFLVGLDLLRDISKTTGLNEWISLNESQAYDPSKLPPMPAFVEKFVMLLRWILPIVKGEAPPMATGKKGMKALMALMAMVDDCMFSLATVPDHSAKYKMFMALKRIQTNIENKLSFHFHPDPLKNKSGLLENPFMQAKERYAPNREALYKVVQIPKEAWNNSILEQLRQQPNIERYYDTVPPQVAKALKSLCAMDAAYDMQPWVDVDHAKRTHDNFADFDPSFGGMPPESGYLAKNSPRAVFNVAETLIQTAGYLAGQSSAQTREILRNPYYLAKLIKAMMTSSVNRELGTVEVLSKFGIMGQEDFMGSPDASRIWEDPEIVNRDIEMQVKELMGSIATEAAMMKQGEDQQNMQATAMQEAARDEGQAAGPGPMGPMSRAMPTRR